MKRIIKQEVFYCDKIKDMPIVPVFYRRTELEDNTILWERPSQYGTFTFVMKRDSQGLEEMYNNLQK